MEQYVKKPAAVQVFALNGATDIILRKDIASEKITDEEGNKQTVWNCDERQIRVAFAVTEEEVTADFDSWWDYQPPREADAENHLQIICIRSVVQAVADAVLAVCKERKLTDAKLYTSHWA